MSSIKEQKITVRRYLTHTLLSYFISLIINLRTDKNNMKINTIISIMVFKIIF